MQEKKHTCILKKPPNPGLRRLAPNDPCYKKFLNKIRACLILDEESKRSRYLFRSSAHRRSELKRCKMEQKWFVIHPFSKGKLIFDFLFYVVWSSILFSHPLRYMGKYPKSLELIAQGIISKLKWVMFVLMFCTGYVKQNEVVVSWKKILFNYLKTFFVIDIVIFTIEPMSEIISGLNIQVYRAIWYKYWYYASIDMIFGLIRIMSLLTSIERSCEELNINRITAFMLYHVYSLIYFLHFFTCLNYIVPWACYENNFPHDSWIHRAKIFSKDSDLFYRYCECYLLTICCFFGATYNKFKIDLPLEQLTVSLISIIGRLYTLWFLAKILKLFGIVTMSETKYEQGIMAINDYILAKKLPTELKDRLLAFYEFKFQRKYFKKEELISHLSDLLKSEIFLFGARYLIEKATVLRKLDKYILGSLFAHMKSETYLPGDVVVKSGDLIDTVHFVCSGTVVVYTKYGYELNHLKDGSDLGFQKNWISTPYKYKYTYICIETTEIYYIPVKTFVNFIKEKLEIVEYFENKTLKDMNYYKELENERVTIKRETFLDNLKAGNILESRQFRHFMYE